MKNSAQLLAAAAALGLAAPAAAQNPYPYPYPNQGYPQQQAQPVPAYPNQQYGYPNQQYGYPQQQYGYQQGYGTNAVNEVIDQLLGNRYNVTDRQAIRQCAMAAMNQASAQYGGSAYQGYPQQYRYGQQYGYNQQSGYNRFHVTAISDVQRRSNGLRVTGTLNSGGGYGNHGYGNQAYGGYPNGAYAAGDLRFRCNVDYQGAVTNVRVQPANAYRAY